jgi:DNA polymerase-3 subunit gamma/tau
LAALPVVQPVAPLAALPVRDGVGSEFKENSDLALSNQAQAAIEVVAVPVRELPEPEAPATPVPMPQGAATADGEFWFALVQDMIRAETIGALVRELALQSQLVARDDTDTPAHWMLRVENTSLNQANARDRLQQALQRHGHAVRLVVEVGKVGDSPSRRLAAAAAQRQAEAEQAVLQDPFVQKMMRDFGGKIVPGTLRPLSA